MEIRPVLARYVPLSNLIVQTFGADCEVVLHDLADPEHSVVYVANGVVTNRQIGQSFDQLIRQVILSETLKDDYVANYYFQASNGQLVRSSTLLIRDEQNCLAGALCINLDTSRITQQMDYLKTFLPERHDIQNEPPATQPAPENAHVMQMVTSLIDNILGNCDPQEMSRDMRVEKIRFMDAKGVFLMRGSVEQIAKRLGVNKVTVYSYLDEARGKRTGG